MVGPYSVAELRVTQALSRRGGRIPKDGVNVYLTDTLASPHANPPAPGLFYEPIAHQRRRALEVKEGVPVLVCLGNPPYDRHAADSGEPGEERKGGWVRWGDDGKPETAILRDFLDPARAAGHGVHLKNLYNLYVYFWRWALWKVFEHKTASGPGIVSFISASSYLLGDAFVGMREHLRHQCDELWIIDLGGEGRGTRREENVFAIQTPVAIAVVVRYGRVKAETPATVRYARIRGDRETKLNVLASVRTFDDLDWSECPRGWQEPFWPRSRGTFFRWPLLTDLFPWQHSGSQVKRLWPIAPDTKTLERRWRALLTSPDRNKAFRPTRDRSVVVSCDSLLGTERHAPLADLLADSPMPRTRRYSYRSLDRQWVIADARMGDFMRPVLWQVHGPKQVFLTSLFDYPLDVGPAVTACAEVPDLHHFRGSFGAKHAVPLWRDAAGTEPNLLPGLLDALAEALGRAPLPEDLLAYVYGVLGNSTYTVRFWEELETREIRVPLTKNRRLFDQAAELGRRLLWLHSYGERFIPRGKRRGEIPKGAASCARAPSSELEEYPEAFSYDEDSRTLRVGDGVFAPVAKEVWNYQVSGLRVVSSWLSYRMKDAGQGGTSPLDLIHPESWTPSLTRELLDLLWVLEATLALGPDQEKVLAAVVAGPLFEAAELPAVPDAARKPPPTRRPSQGQGDFGFGGDDNGD